MGAVAYALVAVLGAIIAIVLMTIAGVVGIGWYILGAIAGACIFMVLFAFAVGNA